jgi:hypothetical protein
VDPGLIGLISAATALVATVAGPIVALSVARRQFNASVLSANREKWIEALRDTLAELISLMAGAVVVKARWRDKWDKGRGALNAEPALLEKFERIVLAQVRIRLLTDPSKADDQRLYQAIEAAVRRLQSEVALDAETEADIEIIVGLAQAILQREWQRVKLGT